MTNRLNTPSAVLVALAEEQSEALGEASAILESVSWELDAALSALRKDEAGYRRKNAANAEGGDNYTPGELEEASRRARMLLVALHPALTLAKHWADLDLKLPPASHLRLVGVDFADAERRVVGMHPALGAPYGQPKRGPWWRLFSWRWSDVADVAA